MKRSAHEADLGGPAIRRRQHSSNIETSLPTPLGKSRKASKRPSSFEVIKAKIIDGTVEPRDYESLSTRRTQDAVRIRRDLFVARLLKYAHTPYDTSFDDDASKDDEEKDVARDLVKSLVKKMDKCGRLNQFAAVFDSIDKASTECFPIVKGLDGRIQVSTRKFQPHLCYPRLFRFPGLRSGRELQPLPHCSKPFTEKFSDVVCINPWHVELLPSSNCARRSPRPSSSSSPALPSSVCSPLTPTTTPSSVLTLPHTPRTPASETAEDGE